MAIEIRRTELPNGLIGECGYILTGEAIKLISEVELIEGKTYTFSMYIKAEANKSIEIHASESEEFTRDVTTEWNKVTATYIYDGDLLYVSIPIGEYYILNCLLEEGNIASDWTPAPQDTISTVDVEYYLSSSRLEPIDGEWSTTAPDWVEGKYMWSRTKKVDGLGNITYMPSIVGTCIAGATGEKGTSVTSIVEEYYLSTSKISPTGGEWSETPPTWQEGYYIWTRSRITYSNPYSVYYTTAVCDSSWDAVNEIEVGGRNFARKGCIVLLSPSSQIVNAVVDDDFIKSGSVEIDKTMPGSGYSIILDRNVLYHAGSKYIVGFNMTISETYVNNIKIFNGYNFTNGKVFIDGAEVGGLNEVISYPNDGNSHMIKITFTGVDVDQISAAEIGINHLRMEIDPNGGGSYTSYFTNYKIEIGTKQTSWTPSPEDFNSVMNELNTLIVNNSAELSKGIDNIRTKVAQEYITKDDLDKFNRTNVQSAINQTAESITQTFDKRIVDMGGNIESINTDITNLNKYIKTDVEGIHIGSSNNANVLHLDNEEIEFLNNGSVKTRITNDGIHTGNLYVDLTESATFGNFAFVPRSDGSLMFLRVRN